MTKVILTFVLLSFLIPVDFSFAQSDPPGGIKIYSGYLHQFNLKNKPSFWHAIFGPKSSQEEIVHNRQCSIEFKSPVPFSHQSVAVLPEQLSYFITFNDGHPFKAGPVKGKNRFGKFVIEIYSSDDQEYSLDPAAEGKQVGINDEHHIFDSYLIYLILGQNIDHLEIVHPTGSNKEKYVLDKLEIHDNH